MSRFRPIDIAPNTQTLVCRTRKGSAVHKPGTEYGRTQCGKQIHGPPEYVVIETVDWCHPCYGKGVETR